MGVSLPNVVAEDSLLIERKHEYPLRKESIELHEVGLHNIVRVSTNNNSLVDTLYLLHGLLKRAINNLVSHSMNILYLEQILQIDEFEVELVRDGRCELLALGVVEALDTNESLPFGVLEVLDEEL